MWTAITTFVTKKLFSELGIMILIGGFIVLLFAGPVTETFLTKFGFETKTSLKADLTSTKKDLETVVKANETVSSELTITKKNLETAMQTIEDARLKNEKLDKDVKDITTVQVTKSKPHVAKLKETTKVTPTEVIIDKASIDAVSEVNIDALNETYDSLFPSKRT